MRDAEDKRASMMPDQLTTSVYVLFSLWLCVVRETVTPEVMYSVLKRRPSSQSRPKNVQMKTPKLNLPESKSLVCLLQALRGMEVTVELRNETSIRGIMDTTDTSLNISLNDVTCMPLEGKPEKYANLYIHGRNVRYVHIPEDVNMPKAMDQQIQKLIEARKKYSRGLRWSAKEKTQA